jgi:hypothetical protein
LLSKAREAGHCLYYAKTIRVNGRLQAEQPWRLDWDSKPEPKPEKKETDPLQCPFCGKQTSSASGRTLHVKSNHSDRLGEYKKWLKSLGKH